jgi:hypothetical protein
MAEGQPQTRCSLRFLFVLTGTHAVSVLVIIAAVSLFLAA